MVLELNGLIEHIKAKVGSVDRQKTEILIENKVKICTICSYNLVKDIGDFGDFKFLGVGTSTGNAQEIFFQYLPN